MRGFSVMRNTLIYSLIKNAKDNFNRSIESSKFFEISKSIWENWW